MKKNLLASALSAIVLSTPIVAAVQPTLSYAQSDEVSKIYNITKAESKILNFKKTIKRAMVANPDRATLKVISASELLVTAKTVGTTELFINFTANPSKTYRYQIKVEENPEQQAQIEKTIRDLLQKLNPAGTVDFEVRSIWVDQQSNIQRQIDEVGNQIDGGKNLSSSASQDKEVLQTEQTVGSSRVSVQAGNLMVILSGKVPNEAQKKRIQSVISTLGVSVLNMIDISGPQEVKLQVRVAEVVKGNPFKSGMIFGNKNINSGIFPPNTNGGNYLLGALAGISQLSPAVAGTFQLGVNSSDGDMFGILSVLEGNNLARILARPELTVQSGETAEFLVGGEVPIPVSQNENSVTVRYKEFGVRLRFSPLITESGEIKLTVAPEISNIDESAGAESGGVIQPGFRSRRAKTTVTLAPGQSFVIGGLIQDSFESSVSKVPLLGDIPILGALFRSSSFNKDQTEMAIVVTPTFVEPIEKGVDIRLPGEDMVAPSNSDAFWYGKVSESLPEGQKAIPELTTKIGLEKP
ncbi:pilus assembly protein CpaC [uncultured Thiomicrorhabdus sp.]|jgi:pilus assembly protein CpaC